MLNKISFSLIIVVQLLIFSWQPVAASSLVAPIISAVQITGGTGSTSNDFIELYNPGDQPFNLNGYRLVKRTATGTSDSIIKSWTTDTFIPTHSFYLWANTTFASVSIAPDLTSTATLADNNGVALRFGALDTGTVIDSVSWGTASNIFTNVSSINPAANESLVRADLFDLTLGYKIRLSAPRNSSIQVSPPLPTPMPSPDPLPIPTPSPDPLPTAAPTLIDSSECANSAQTMESETGKVNSIVLKFTNNGTTTWDSNYTLHEKSFNATYPLTGPVNPAQSADLVLPIAVPLDPGAYNYQFQIQNATPFGSTCNVLINAILPVVAPVPIPEIPKIRINELLPNPIGDDNGNEKIELYNYGTSKIDLTGFMLDDVAATDPISSNVYKIPTLSMEPESFAVITLPAGSFAMNNTNGDIVTLFDASFKSINSVFYEGSADENKSYSYFDNNWQWTDQTFGAVNLLPPPAVIPQPAVPPVDEYVKPTIRINEVYPNPKKGETEFVELYNYGDADLQVKDLNLWVGEKYKTLNNDYVITPGEYYLIEDKDLPTSLRNIGQTIKLSDKISAQLDEVTYQKSITGNSYSLFEDGYLWTTNPTPNEENILVVPDDKKPKVLAANTIEKLQTPKRDSLKTVPIAVTKPKQVAAKPSVAKKAVAAIISAVNPKETITEESGNNNTSVKQESKNGRPSVTLLLLAGSSTIAAGMWIAYRYAMKDPTDLFN